MRRQAAADMSSLCRRPVYVLRVAIEPLTIISRSALTDTFGPSPRCPPPSVGNPTQLAVSPYPNSCMRPKGSYSALCLVGGLFRTEAIVHLCTETRIM